MLLARMVDYPFAGEFWELRHPCHVVYLATKLRWNIKFCSRSLQRI
jgi:hypothetical protein